MLGKTLNFRDKFVVTILLLIIVASLVFWGGSFYFNFTKPIPKIGGEYIEGIVGQPLYINPLLSQTSEADLDLTKLIYSGLFKYDKDGKIISDVAEGYSVSEDKKEYSIAIRKDVIWHDGQQLNAEDVFFTYNILQDPSYNSLLRQSFAGVEVRLVDDYTVAFSLKNPYAGFLDNLTVGILPKHIWQDIAPEKFALAEYNLHPIGSGPYLFSDMQKDKDGNILTLKLSAFKNYYNQVPYISKFIFNFYSADDAMLDAYNKKEIMGMSSIPPERIKNIKNAKSTNVRELIIPRYFAVFFNQTRSVPLADDEVRKALEKSVDRKELINKVLYDKGLALSSPFFPQMECCDAENRDQADIEEAKKILDEAGWKLDEGENIRKKNKENLEFELITTDWPELVQTAELLRSQWEKIGLRVNVKVLSVSDLQQNYIRTREYDSILFGQAISFNPDLYSFWHSSQKHDPGLNLSLFDNKDADGILDGVRQGLGESERIENYKKFQKILSEETPAVFLYTRYYLYTTSKKLQGSEMHNINSSEQRFSDVNKWYVKTKRVWK